MVKEYTKRHRNDYLTRFETLDSLVRDRIINRNDFLKKKKRTEKYKAAARQIQNKSTLIFTGLPVFWPRGLLQPSDSVFGYSWD